MTNTFAEFDAESVENVPPRPRIYFDLQYLHTKDGKAKLCLLVKKFYLDIFLEIKNVFKLNFKIF
jgi:hypothetical protein